MAQKIDSKVFNTDPKFGEQRETFDEMVESSVNRIIERKKKSKDKEDMSFGEMLDNLFRGD